MTVSGFRVKEVYRASGHVRTSGIVGIGDRALSGFSRLRVLTRNFREIILGKCLRREGQELGIFTRIIGKCRGGYRDKTVEVLGRGLGSCISLSLTPSPHHCLHAVQQNDHHFTILVITATTSSVQATASPRVSASVGSQHYPRRHHHRNHHRHHHHHHQQHHRHRFIAISTYFLR